MEPVSKKHDGPRLPEQTIRDNLAFVTSPKPISAHRFLLVTATRDLASGIFNRGVAASVARRWFRAVGGWLKEHGGTILFKSLLFVIILFVTRFVSRMSRVAVERSLDSSKLSLSRLLRRMIVSSTANLILALGLMLALNQVGVSLGPLLAGVGVAGFIVGFALQDSLANFAAGMMIQMYRPYDVGDVVEAAGVFRQGAQDESGFDDHPDV